jgi:hypothetical protein
MNVAEIGADGGGGAAHTLARSQQVARWLVEGCSTARFTTAPVVGGG